MKSESLSNKALMAIGHCLCPPGPIYMTVVRGKKSLVHLLGYIFLSKSSVDGIIIAPVVAGEPELKSDPIQPVQGHININNLAR